MQYVPVSAGQALKPFPTRQAIKPAMDSRQEWSGLRHWVSGVTAQGRTAVAGLGGFRRESAIRTRAPMAVQVETTDVSSYQALLEVTP